LNRGRLQFGQRVRVGRRLKSVALQNELAVDEDPIGLRPKSGQQPGPLLLDDDRVALDRDMPLPFQLHGIVRERVQRGLQHFVPRAGVQRATAGGPIAREFDSGSIDVERELDAASQPSGIQRVTEPDAKTPVESGYRFARHKMKIKS